MLRLKNCAGESGNASLEFITAGMILLLPIVYLILTMAALQAAALAVEGAARQAARVFVQAEGNETGRVEAERAVQFALADYGFDSADARVEFTCSPRPDDCLQRLATVTVTVAISVTLPLVPAAIDVAVPLQIPMQSTATQQVSRFWGAR